MFYLKKRDKLCKLHNGVRLFKNMQQSLNKLNLKKEKWQNYN
jgi:hypothetical protein